jgi:hypothetical protein
MACSGTALAPSINASNKGSYLFTYFPILEKRLAGEQTAVTSIDDVTIYVIYKRRKKNFLFQLLLSLSLSFRISVQPSTSQFP